MTVLVSREGSLGKEGLQFIFRVDERSLFIIEDSDEVLIPTARLKSI
jgi:hypothetical protein